MDNRSFLRVGAGAAVVGAVLALVGNLAHPRYSNLDDVVRFRKMAGSGVLTAADVILLVALACIVAGLMAVAESLEAGGSLGLARLARTAATVGGTTSLIQIGLETFGVIQAAKLFASAPQSNQVAAFWATSAIDHANTAMFATWTIVLLGVTPVLLGAAMWVGKVYPSWLAAGGVVGGLLCLGVGFVNLLRANQDPTVIPFFIGSLLVTAFVFGAGALLWKRAAVAVA